MGCMKWMVLAALALIGCNSVSSGGLFGANKPAGSGGFGGANPRPFCTPNSIMETQCETGGVGGASFDKRTCFADGSGYTPSTCKVLGGDGGGGAGGAG